MESNQLGEVPADDEEPEDDGVRCIVFPEYHDQRKNMAKRTWCGEFVQGWCFTDVEHAAQHALSKAFLLVCPTCITRINEALNFNREV